jgi:hypothetical protein
MSGLARGVPRALLDHRSREGWVYRRYCQATVARLGPLPAAAMPTLKEAALATLDLARLRSELEALRARRGGGVRRKQERALRSEIRKTRVQLVLLERRIEQFAGLGSARHGLEPAGADLVERLLAMPTAEQRSAP